MSNKPTVVIAMSGGVDSSVAAALLVEQGYPVVGMMLRLWSEPGAENQNRCCTPDDMAQARRVAAQIGIPFYALDARDEFRDQVVQAFFDGYSSGITPNPCAVCNRQIRWGFLLKHAQRLDAQYLATGHYARIEQAVDGKILLRRGVDDHKDQSYVLSQLRQDQLAHSLFPLGTMYKTDVREHARRLDLIVADKAESQDLCFLGRSNYRDFLARHIPQVAASGPILRRDGTKLGEHGGLAFYTIGQRKGLGIVAPEPFYVLEKDLERNALIVGVESELGESELVIKEFNWVSRDAGTEVFRAQVKIRYRANLAWATAYPIDASTIKLQFDQPMRDITPGQLAVLYEEDLVLGGGKIDSIRKD